MLNVTAGAKLWTPQQILKTYISVTETRICLG